MDATALHLEVRNALSLCDELARYEHAEGNDSLAGHLASVRTMCDVLERELGRSHEDAPVPGPVVIERLARSVATLRQREHEVPAPRRARVVQLLDCLDRIVFAERRPSAPVPAKKLFGRLPLARLIPQDVHSAMDYLGAAAYFASAAVARTTRARSVGLLLGTQVGSVSLTTDYRLSLAKVIPIELHELADHGSGAAGALMPALLGYLRSDPVASAIQIVTGVGTVVASLFTDYRADRGVGRALRSKGGPATHRGRRARPPPRRVTTPKKKTAAMSTRHAIQPSAEPVRVTETQRPLEGLAAPSAMPEIEDLDL